MIIGVVGKMNTGRKPLPRKSPQEEVNTTMYNFLVDCLNERKITDKEEINDYIYKFNSCESTKGKLASISDILSELDFDTDKEEFYPVTVAKGSLVKGLSLFQYWGQGSEIPCRKSLCTLTLKE